MHKLFYTLTFGATITVAGAATLTLETAASHQYQQTTNSPCVIGNNSCQGSLPFTLLPNGGTSYDSVSPVYSVADIRNIVGNNFFIGADFNQSNNAQSLDLFTMSINGAVVDTYSASPATSVPTVSNGNGYADYVFKGFTSLTSYDAAATVQFHVSMPVKNAGAEQFFLLTNRVTVDNVTPEPATYGLMGAGLVALGVFRSRRRQ